MDMQVDAQLIRNERLKRAWSQEHLAQVSGLGLRTVQRIENGGNASLETVKALAAVLELRVQALLMEAPARTVASTPSVPVPSSRFRLFKPWRAFAAGCLATLVTMGSFVSMQGALAEEIALDFAFSLNDEAVTRSRVMGEAGEEVIVQIGDGMSFHVTPSITDEGYVLIQAKIYKDGESEPLAKPVITIMNGQKGLFKIGEEDDGGHFTEVGLEVTPTIK